MPIPLGIFAVAGAGAAGGASSFDLLETTVLSSSASSVTFSNLGSYSDYKHLQVRAAIRSARVDSNTVLGFRLNGSSASSYAHHFLTGSGASVSSSAFTSQTWGRIGTIPAANATANVFASAVVDILDFSNANKNTTIKSLIGYSISGDNNISLVSSLWNNTSAVTEISLRSFNVTADLAAGTRVSLYGIK